jgi:hypothetical protein
MIPPVPYSALSLHFCGRRIEADLLPAISNWSLIPPEILYSMGLSTTLQNAPLTFQKPSKLCNALRALYFGSEMKSAIHFLSVWHFSMKRGMFRRSGLVGKSKNVADTGPGLNVLWVSWIGLYFPTQAVNRLPQQAVLPLISHPPHLFQ